MIDFTMYDDNNNNDNNDKNFIIKQSTLYTHTHTGQKKENLQRNPLNVMDHRTRDESCPRSIQRDVFEGRVGEGRYKRTKEGIF
mgnify:CR=1 FL=1